MIKRVFLKIKQYGILEVIKYSLQKISLLVYFSILEKKYNDNKLKINRNFLNNYTTSIKFYYEIDNFKEKIKNFYSENIEIKNNILKDANKIIEHKFSFLSDREYILEKKINWNKDFKSNFIWKKDFYKKIQPTDINNNADVKIPWELSRFQHLFTLGKAFIITEDQKYYLEAKEQIEDWLNENPAYGSVNWTCAMDVAIRAINWIFFYFQFKKLIDKDSIFLSRLNNSLYIHGKFIIKNLEKGLNQGSNHYLSDLAGLVFIGLYFKKLNNREVKKWLDFGIKELEKEMIKENNQDGTNYETSTSYHRLVTELMFYPMYLCELNNINFSKEYKKRLEKMFEFMGKITKSNGYYPLIGDVDNGRVVILSDYYNWKINDCRHIISIGGEYFNNIFLKQVGAKEIEDKFWINNSNNIYEEKFYKQSSSFSDGGYYLLQNENIYCLVRCGELSLKGQGGHSHNDQLSFELNILGEDFIVDTGTGVYTSDKDLRNLFRSTKMHNTVSIKDLEQNSFNENNVFEMKEESFAKCLKFLNNEFIGEHYGYLNKNGNLHNRTFKLERNNLEIIDNIGKSKGTLNLHLDLEVNLYKQRNGLILEKNKVKLFINTENLEYSIKESFISKKYGDIKKTKKIEIYFEYKNNLNITLI